MRVFFKRTALSAVLLAAGTLLAQGAPVKSVPKPLPMFELRTRRMDVDVDGAPNAYGPRGKKTLDVLKNSRLEGKRHGEIVGYLTDDDDPSIPIIQGPNDPCPGFYISQTSYTDHARKDPKDPLRYVDATRINYVVLGDEAKRQGARIGDFVAVYSRKYRKAVYGIVADEGNPSGDEGSLHLLQDLGYPFVDGRDDSVEKEGEVTVRFYPRSNPGRLFFREQEALDAAAKKAGVSLLFATQTASQR